MAGFRFYSVPLASAVAIIINFGLVWRLLHNVIRETSRHGKETRIDWLKEVLPFQWSIMLYSVTVMNQVVFAEAFYLWAHKRELFLAYPVFGGVAMAIGLFDFSYSSAFSISSMYAILTFGGFILGSIVFIYCRSRWHCPELITKEAFQYERK